MTRLLSGRKLHSWLPAPLTDDVVGALNRLARSEIVERVAVMPDVHLCEEVCVGAVVATSSRLLPHAVGGDIGCGMAALEFNCSADVIRNERMAAQILHALRVLVPARRHSGSTAPACLPAALVEAPLSHKRLERLKHRDGRVQFGTLGRGNHFLEFQADEQDALWVMVHSGSRAVGQAITGHHLEYATQDSVGLRHLDAQGTEGQAYLGDVEWARAYAAANRERMLEAATLLVRELFGASANPSSRIACDHNHVQRERHFGSDLWVHRKGALSAQAGEIGIIPGSMGTTSFHVQGRGCPEALASSSHGAGRQLSRSDARRTIGATDLERQMRGVWFDHRIGKALREEAPASYKDIEKVMRAQRELTRAVRRLRPLLTYKGT